MTTEVLTTSAERSVAEITSMMVKIRVGSAVVIEGSWLAGILTEWDVLRAVPRVRTYQGACIAVDDEEPKYGHVRHDSRGDRRHDADQRVSPPPVVEGRELKGVVSIRDVLASGIRRRSNVE
jgi:CBS domain-containing protein